MQKNIRKKIVKKLLHQRLAKPLLESMRKREADFIVVSFPKSGRTWLRFLLSFSLSRQYGVSASSLLRFDTLAAPGAGIPKIHFTHDDRYKGRPDQLHPNKSFYYSRKLLFLVRDPRDIVVSLYFHRVFRDSDYSGSMSDYIFGCAGGIDTLIAFYNIWAANFDRIANKLLIRYEDMHRDPAHELEKVLGFLGVPAVPEYIDYAVRESSFTKMRFYELEDAFCTADLRPGDASQRESFKVRRGKVGGYRDYLTEAEIERLDRLIAERLNPVFGY